MVNIPSLLLIYFISEGTNQPTTMTKGKMQNTEEFYYLQIVNVLSRLFIPVQNIEAISSVTYLCRLLD